MFTVSIAGHRFTVDNRHAYAEELCKAYLREADGTEEIIHVSEAEITREKTENSSPAYSESLAIQRQIAERLIREDVLLFHGSVVAVDGAAYLFTAKSGTGKSTHTQLWMREFGDRAVMVDDDKPFLYISDTEVVAYGTPWNGKHRRGNNISVSLKAICVLERGAGNTIEPLSRKESWPFLIQQSYHPEDPDNMARTLCLLDRLLGCVETYRLRCNMEPEAAQVAFKGMNRHGGGANREVKGQFYHP